MTINKEQIVKSPKSRVKRTSVSTRNRIKLRGEDPNFVYRLVNDVDDRVLSLQELGYTLVDKTEGVTLGDSRLGVADSTGSTVRQSVGGGTQGVLMKIPKEFYKEDQQSKEDFLKQKEATMQAQAREGTYGKLEITRD